MAQTTETLFDTHAHIRALIEAGMPEPQAEAVVRLQVDVLQRHIVTKADAAAIRTDIANLRTWTEAEFANLRTWTEAEFANLRTWTEGEFAKVRAEIAGLRTWSEGEFGTLNTVVSALKTDIAELKDAVSKLNDAVDALKTAKAETIKWVAGLNFATAVFIITVIEIL